MNYSIKHLIGSLALVAMTTSQPASAEIQTRIVGGTTVNIESFPSTVALLRNNSLSVTGSAYHSLFCGGTLIQSNWVLTAAHCLVEENGDVTDPTAISVLAGSGNLSNPNYDSIAVKRVIVSDEYINVVYGADIALIELAYAAPAPAITLTDRPASTNDLAYIAGWGMLEFTQSLSAARFPEELQAAAVRMISGADCVAYGGLHVTVKADKQLCAAVSGGGVDTCKGDSGGPVYAVTPRNTLVLAGITSWGDECAKPDSPGVYTSVFYYKDWINTMINGTPAVHGSPDTIDNPPSVQTGDHIKADGINGSQPRERLSATGSASSFFLLMMFAILKMRRSTRAINLVK